MYKVENKQNKKAPKNILFPFTQFYAPDSYKYEQKRGEVWGRGEEGGGSPGTRG